jgi:PilZ domain
MATTRAMLERRRSSRIRTRVPVTIFRDGARLSAVALGVSRCGALLRVPFSPAIGSRIQVLNDVSQEKREFRVVRVSEPKHDGMFELGVEILYPSRNFWGLRFPDEFADDVGSATSHVEQHQFPRV